MAMNELFVVGHQNSAGALLHPASSSKTSNPKEKEKKKGKKEKEKEKEKEKQREIVSFVVAHFRRPTSAYYTRPSTIFISL